AVSLDWHGANLRRHGTFYSTRRARLLTCSSIGRRTSPSVSIWTVKYSETRAGRSRNPSRCERDPLPEPGTPKTLGSGARNTAVRRRGRDSWTIPREGLKHAMADSRTNFSPDPRAGKNCCDGLSGDRTHFNAV